MRTLSSVFGSRSQESGFGLKVASKLTSAIFLVFALAACGGEGGNTTDYSNRDEVVDHEDDVDQEVGRQPQPLPESIVIRVNMEASEAHPDGLFCIADSRGTNLACDAGEPIVPGTPELGKKSTIDLRISNELIDVVLVARVEGRDHNIKLTEILGALTSDMYFAGLGVALRRPLDENGFPATLENGRPKYVQSQALINPVVLSSLSTARYELLNQQSGISLETMLDGGLLNEDAVDALASFYQLYIDSAPPEGSNMAAEVEFGIMMNANGDLIDEDGNILSDFQGNPISMSALFSAQAQAQANRDILIAQLLEECSASPDIQCPANMNDHVSVAGHPMGGGVVRLEITQTFPEEKTTFLYVDENGNPILNEQGNPVTHAMMEETASREDPIFISADGYWRNAQGDIVNYVTGSVIRSSASSGSPGVYTDSNGNYVRSDGAIISLADDSSVRLVSALGDGLYEDSSGFVTRFDPVTGQAHRVTLRTVNGEDIIRTYYTWDVYRQYRTAKERAVRYEVSMCIPSLPASSQFPNPSTPFFDNRPALQDPFTDQNPLVSTPIQDGEEHALSVFESVSSARRDAGHLAGQRIGSQRGYWEGYFGLPNRASNPDMTNTGKLFDDIPNHLLADNEDEFVDAYNRKYAAKDRAVYEEGFDAGYRTAYIAAYNQGQTARASFSPEMIFGEYSDARSFTVPVTEAPADPQGPYEAGRAFSLESFSSQNTVGNPFREGRMQARTIGKELAEIYALTSGTHEGITASLSDGFQREGPYDSIAPIPAVTKLEARKTAALDSLQWSASSDADGMSATELYAQGITDGFIEAYNSYLRDAFSENFDSIYAESWRTAYEFSAATAAVFSSDMILYQERSLDDHLSTEQESDGASAAASSFPSTHYEDGKSFLERDVIESLLVHAGMMGGAQALRFIDGVEVVQRPGELPLASGDNYGPFVEGYVNEVMRLQFNHFWDSAEDRFAGGLGMRDKIDAAEQVCVDDVTAEASSLSADGVAYVLSPSASARALGRNDGFGAGALDKSQGLDGSPARHREEYGESGEFSADLLELSGMAAEIAEIYWDAYWTAFEVGYATGYEAEPAVAPPSSQPLMLRPYMPEPLLHSVVQFGEANFSQGGDLLAGANVLNGIYSLVPLSQIGVFDHLESLVADSGLPQALAIQARKQQREEIFNQGIEIGRDAIEVEKSGVFELVDAVISALTESSAVHHGIRYYLDGGDDEEQGYIEPFEALWGQIESRLNRTEDRSWDWGAEGSELSNALETLLLEGYSEGYRSAFLSFAKDRFEDEQVGLRAMYRQAFNQQKAAIEAYIVHVNDAALFLAGTSSLTFESLSKANNQAIQDSALEWAGYIASESNSEEDIDNAVSSLIDEWKASSQVDTLDLIEQLNDGDHNGRYADMEGFDRFVASFFGQGGHEEAFWSELEAFIANAAKDAWASQEVVAPEEGDDAFEEAFNAAILGAVSNIENIDPMIATFSFDEYVGSMASPFDNLLGVPSAWLEEDMPVWLDGDELDVSSDVISAWRKLLTDRAEAHALAAQNLPDIADLDGIESDILTEQIARMLIDETGRIRVNPPTFVAKDAEVEVGQIGYAGDGDPAPLVGAFFYHVGLETLSLWEESPLKSDILTLYRFGKQYGYGNDESCRARANEAIVGVIQGDIPELQENADVDQYLDLAERIWLADLLSQAYFSGVRDFSGDPSACVVDEGEPDSFALALQLNDSENYSVSRELLGIALVARYLSEDVASRARETGALLGGVDRNNGPGSPYLLELEDVPSLEPIPNASAAFTHSMIQAARKLYQQEFNLAYLYEFFLGEGESSYQGDRNDRIERDFVILMPSPSDHSYINLEAMDLAGSMASMLSLVEDLDERSWFGDRISVLSPKAAFFVGYMTAHSARSSLSQEVTSSAAAWGNFHGLIDGSLVGNYSLELDFMDGLALEPADAEVSFLNGFKLYAAKLYREEYRRTFNSAVENRIPIAQEEPSEVPEYAFKTDKGIKDLAEAFLRMNDPASESMETTYLNPADLVLFANANSGGAYAFNALLAIDDLSVGELFVTEYLDDRHHVQLRHGQGFDSFYVEMKPEDLDIEGLDINPENIVFELVAVEGDVNLDAPAPSFSDAEAYILALFHAQGPQGEGFGSGMSAAYSAANEVHAALIAWQHWVEVYYAAYDAHAEDRDYAADEPEPAVDWSDISHVEVDLAHLQPMMGADLALRFSVIQDVTIEDCPSIWEQDDIAASFVAALGCANGWNSTSTFARTIAESGLSEFFDGHLVPANPEAWELGHAVFLFAYLQSSKAVADQPGLIGELEEVLAYIAGIESGAGPSSREFSVGGIDVDAGIETAALSGFEAWLANLQSAIYSASYDENETSNALGLSIQNIAWEPVESEVIPFFESDLIGLAESRSQAHYHANPAPVDLGRTRGRNIGYIEGFNKENTLTGESALPHEVATVSVDEVRARFATHFTDGSGRTSAEPSSPVSNIYLQVFVDNFDDLNREAYTEAFSQGYLEEFALAVQDRAKADEVAAVAAPVIPVFEVPSTPAPGGDVPVLDADSLPYNRGRARAIEHVIANYSSQIQAMAVAEARGENDGIGFARGYLHGYYAGVPGRGYNEGTGLVRDVAAENLMAAWLEELANPAHVLDEMVVDQDSYALGYQHGFKQKYHGLYIAAYQQAFESAYNDGRALGLVKGFGDNPLEDESTNPPDAFRDDVAHFYSSTDGQHVMPPAVDAIALGKAAGRAVSVDGFGDTGGALYNEARARLLPWGAYNAYRYLMEYHAGSNSGILEVFSPGWNTDVTAANAYNRARTWGYQKQYLETYLAGAGAGYSEGFQMARNAIADASSDTQPSCVSSGSVGQIIGYDNLPSPLPNVLTARTDFMFSEDPRDFNILEPLRGVDSNATAMDSSGRVLVADSYDTFTSMESPADLWRPNDIGRPDFPNEGLSVADRLLSPDWWAPRAGLGFDGPASEGITRITKDGGYDWHRRVPSQIEPLAEVWASAYRESSSQSEGVIMRGDLWQSAETVAFPQRMNLVHPSDSSVSRFRRADVTVTELVRDTEYRYFQSTSADQRSENRPAVLSVAEFYELQGIDYDSLISRDESGNILDSAGNVRYRVINVGAEGQFSGVYQDIRDAENFRGYLVNERGERIPDWAGVMSRSEGEGLAPGETWEGNWAEYDYQNYFVTADIEHFFLRYPSLALHSTGSIIDDSGRIVRSIDSGSATVLPAMNPNQESTLGNVVVYEGVSGTQYEQQVYEIGGVLITRSADNHGDQTADDALDVDEFRDLIRVNSYIGNSVFITPDGVMMDAANIALGENGVAIEQEAGAASLKLHQSGLFVDQAGRLVDENGDIGFTPIGNDLYVRGRFDAVLGAEGVPTAEYGAQAPVFRIEDINLRFGSNDLISIAGADDITEHNAYVTSLGEYFAMIEGQGLRPTGTFDSFGNPIFYDEDGSLVSVSPSGDITVIVASENAPAPKPSVGDLSQELAAELGANQFTDGYDFNGKVGAVIEEDTDFTREEFNASQDSLKSSAEYQNDVKPSVIGAVNGLSLSGRSFVSLNGINDWSRVAFERNGQSSGKMLFINSAGLRTVSDYEMTNIQLNDGSWQVRINGNELASISPSMQFTWNGVVYQTPGLSVRESSIFERSVVAIGLLGNDLGFTTMRSSQMSSTFAPLLPGGDSFSLNNIEFDYGIAQMENGRNAAINVDIVAMPGRTLFGDAVRSRMYPVVGEGLLNSPVWHTNGTVMGGQTPSLVVERDPNYNMVPVPSDPNAPINLSVPNFRRVMIGGDASGRSVVEFWQFLPTLEGHIIGWETGRDRPRSTFYPQRQGLPDVTITSSGGGGKTTAVALRSQNIWGSGYRYHTYIGDLSDGTRMFGRLEDFKPGTSGAASSGSKISDLFKVFDVIPWSSLGAGYYSVDDYTTIRLGSNGTLVSLQQEAGGLELPPQEPECATDSNGNIIYEFNGFQYSSQCVMITPEPPVLTMDYLGERRDTTGGDIIAGAGSRRFYSRDVIRVEGRRIFNNRRANVYNNHVNRYGAENVELLGTRRVRTFYTTETLYRYQVRLAPQTNYYMLLETRTGSTRQRYVLAVYQNTADSGESSMRYSIRRL